MTVAEKITLQRLTGETKEFVPEAGSHSPDGKACVMEAVSWLADERWSDAPECASPVIGAFCRSFWDSSPDNWPGLLERIDRIAGSAKPEADEARAWMATDWLVRVFTPTWLRKAGLTEDAAALEALPALTTTELTNAALPVIQKARANGAAAWDAARAAAWAAAGAAAGAAAWDAARAAARDAARAAAGDAAWDAARAAAGDAAGDAARAAARAAAGDAAWAAARAAAGAAAWAAAGAAAGAAARAAAKSKRTYATKYDAAYKAARSVVDVALAETVTELRASAFGLLDRMLAA